MFKPHLVFGLLLLLGVSSQKDEDEGGPYEFSFTIDGEQHRYEKKDVNGIIQGEFGFITGDGVYHVTVYATDENGSFKILSMKNTKISEPLDRGGKPSTANLVRQPAAIQQPTGGVPPKPAKPIAQPLLPAAIPTPLAVVTAPPTARPLQPVVTTSRTPYDFTTASTVRNGCSGCGIVTKAPPGPLNFQNPAFKKSGKEGNKPLASPAQPPSYSKQPVPPPEVSGNGIPPGLVSKPFFPSGQSSNYPNKPSGPSISLPNGQPAPPQTVLLAPGTNSGPTGSDSPTEQNPFGPVHQPTGITGPTEPQRLGPSPPISQSSPRPYPVNKPTVTGPTEAASLSPRPAISQPSSRPTQNQIPGNPPSVLSQAKVGDGQPSPGRYPVNKPTVTNGPTEAAPLGPRPPIGQPSPGPYPVNPTEAASLSPRPAISQASSRPTQNQIPGNPPSVLSRAKVGDGVIDIPGNKPIVIKDKYPNMVDGLPEGITERDITDLLYKFNYTVGFHGHYEKGLKNGGKIGGYFVNGRDGISRVVTYVADENGYRPKFKLVNLGLDSEDTPKPDSEKKFGLKNFEFVWYPIT